MTSLVRPLAVLFSLVGLTAAGWAIAPQARAQASMFSTQEVDQSKFIIVAAPIGDGSRAQLNIYEQRTAQRPCYAVSGSRPALVDPLLASFDFTGICNRFIDGNGYSLRIGTSDLGTVYRLSVVKDSAETLLIAQPTRPEAGPEMVVARTGGPGNGFLQLVAEPGWRVMRRSFGNRALGHVYVYRDSWPGAATATTPAAGPTTPAATLPAQPKATAETRVPAEIKAPAETKAPAEPKGTTKSSSLPAQPAPATSALAKPVTPAPGGSRPSPAVVPLQATSSAQGGAASPGPASKPGLGASAAAAGSSVPAKPGPGAPASGSVQAGGASKPVEAGKPVEASKPGSAPKPVTATKAVDPARAVDPAQAVDPASKPGAAAKPPKPLAAAPKPTAPAPKPAAAAPLAVAPNLPALPAVGPAPAASLH